jgi:hypothetical protein
VSRRKVGGAVLGTIGHPGSHAELAAAAEGGGSRPTRACTRAGSPPQRKIASAVAEESSLADLDAQGAGWDAFHDGHELPAAIDHDQA